MSIKIFTFLYTIFIQIIINNEIDHKGVNTDEKL